MLKNPTYELAPISVRIVAFMIDMMIGQIARVLIGWLALPNIPYGANGELITEGIIMLMLVFVYFCVVPVYFQGRTVGKALIGIRIVSIDDEPITVFRMFMRNWPGYLASGVVFGLGFMWAMQHPRRQAWHDIGARTVVVKGSVR